MASPLLRKALFPVLPSVEAGGLFEPLQLGPQFLLANAERDGEKYAVSLGAPSVIELRRLPASHFTGNAGGIVHAVIEPYVLPASPYEAFAAGRQNDVPLLIGSNADEARAMVDVLTRDSRQPFIELTLQRSVGQLSCLLWLAAQSPRHRQTGAAGAARPRTRPPLRLGHVGLGEVTSRNRPPPGLLLFVSAAASNT